MSGIKIIINTLTILLLITCTNTDEMSKPYKITLIKWTSKNGKIRAKGLLINGQKQGLWNEFMDDGNLATQCEYMNDTLNGKCIGYWKSGELMIDGLYKKGLKEDNWFMYYENGTVMQNGIYKEDMRVGSWMYFYENGSLERKKIYSSK